MKRGIFNQPGKPIGAGGKKIKSPYEFDPSDTNTRAGPKVAAGDYYGSGVKAKVGRMRDGFGMNPVSEKGLRTPPKALA